MSWYVFYLQCTAIYDCFCLDFINGGSWTQLSELLKANQLIYYNLYLNKIPNSLTSVGQEPGDSKSNPYSCPTIAPSMWYGSDTPIGVKKQRDRAETDAFQISFSKVQHIHNIWNDYN